MLCGGRLGRPLRFLFVDFVILDSDGMCSDRWGFARAHLEGLEISIELRWYSNDECLIKEDWGVDE